MILIEILTDRGWVAVGGTTGSDVSILDEFMADLRKYDPGNQYRVTVDTSAETE